MKIDLHIHTHPRSPCSSLRPEELVREAQKAGVQGICVTEHGVLWTKEEVERLSSNEEGIRVFRGIEVTTDQGDILVFGYYGDLPRVVPIVELRRKIAASCGFMVAAHPFRGFLLFGIGQLNLTPEQASQRPVFSLVDAIEIGNSKVTDQENQMAREVAARIGLPGVAGSDAHAPGEVGRWVTIFEKDIADEEQLVEELRGGRFSVLRQG